MVWYLAQRRLYLHFPLLECLLLILILCGTSVSVCPCHHDMAHPQVVEGSCEYIE